MKAFNRGWHFAGRRATGDTILIGGVDPWTVPWGRPCGTITVIDTLRSPQETDIPTYTVESPHGPVLFAAAESSNNVWGFWEYVPPE